MQFYILLDGKQALLLIGIFFMFIFLRYNVNALIVLGLTVLFYVKSKVSTLDLLEWACSLAIYFCFLFL
jgi:hypothetical protein